MGSLFDPIYVSAARQIQRLRGEAVTYDAGTPTEVTGVFTEEPSGVATKADTDAGFEVRGPFVRFLIADLPGDPEADDPTITIRSVAYSVIERTPNGMGGIEFHLRTGFAASSFVHVVSRTRNPSDLTGPATVTTTEHACRALARAYERRFIDGTSVRESDFQVVISRETISPAGLPAPGDTITCNPPGSSSPVTATIVAVIAVAEGSVTVQVRGAGV